MSEMDELKQHITNLEHLEQKGQTVERLMGNLDFKKIFLEDLFVFQVNELQQNLYKYAPESAEYRQIVRELDAISYVRQHIKKLLDAAVTARNDLREARAEFLNDEEQ